MEFKLKNLKQISDNSKKHTWNLTWQKNAAQILPDPSPFVTLRALTNDLKHKASNFTDLK